MQKLFFIASALIDSVAPSSPRIGKRSVAFLNVTAKDANGEIGFSAAHQTKSVQEPVGPSSLFIQLPVRRTGTADRVVVYWNITSDSATFYTNDTGQQSGEVVFEQGIDVNFATCSQYCMAPENNLIPAIEKFFLFELPLPL